QGLLTLNPGSARFRPRTGWSTAAPLDDQPPPHKASPQMRLFSGKIPLIAEEIVTSLTAAEDIEVESRDEVQSDLEAVLAEYLRTEREIVDEAKNRLE